MKTSGRMQIYFHVRVFSTLALERGEERNKFPSRAALPRGEIFPDAPEYEAL
jgi:hypothetical protein